MGVEGRLFLAGVSHHATSLEVRERFVLQEGMEDALCRVLCEEAGVRELLVLNTCNRVELYGLLAEGDSGAGVIEAFCRVQGVERALYERHAVWLAGREVVAHAFKVACGLDSQLVGETEILGQLKQAYAAARQRGQVSVVLNQVFQKSFQTAKWIRTHTAIGRGQTSVGNVAADLAGRIFGELAAARILMVGAGEVGELVVKSLRARGARSLTVMSRRADRAQAMAETYEGVAVPLARLEATLPEFDIVVCATGAPKAVLTLEMVHRAMSGRTGRPLFLMDLAVPRDVEGACGEVSSVYLYNLDDLSAIANQNLEARRAEIGRCCREVEERAARLWERLSAGVSDDAAASPRD